MASRWFQVSLTAANIYIAANPSRRGSRKCTKECIAMLRHLYLDFDIGGEVRPTSLWASDTVLKPTAALSTSLGKYPTLWRVDSFNFERHESTLKLPAIAFGGDPACTDCNWILRWPRFRNCKYDPRYPVTLKYPCDLTSNPAGFRLDIPAPNAMLLHHAIPSRKHPASRPIPNTIGRGFCGNLPMEKAPLGLQQRLLPAALISLNFSTTRSERSMSNRPDLVFRWRTLLSCCL